MCALVVRVCVCAHGEGVCALVVRVCVCAHGEGVCVCSW